MPSNDSEKKTVGEIICEIREALGKSRQEMVDFINHEIDDSKATYLFRRGKIPAMTIDDWKNTEFNKKAWDPVLDGVVMGILLKEVISSGIPNNLNLADISLDFLDSLSSLRDKNALENEVRDLKTAIQEQATPNHPVKTDRIQNRGYNSPKTLLRDKHAPVSQSHSTRARTQTRFKTAKLKFAQCLVAERDKSGVTAKAIDTATGKTGNYANWKTAGSLPNEETFKQLCEALYPSGDVSQELKTLWEAAHAAKASAMSR